MPAITPKFIYLSSSDNPKFLTTKINTFTPAEKRIFELLFIYFNTIKYHIKNIYKKLWCSSKNELYAKFRSFKKAETHSKIKNWHIFCALKNIL